MRNVALSPSRFARIEEALSLEFRGITSEINRINRDFNLGDFSSENRALFPWANFLTAPEPFASRTWEYPWAITEAHLSSGMLCADVGCGQTPFTIYLREIADCEVVGFDSQVGVRTDRPWWGVSDEFANATRVSFVKSSLDRLEWPDDSFDRVFCVSVIEHVDSKVEQSQGIREIARILKPGGLAIISVDVVMDPEFVNPLALVWDSGLLLRGTTDLTLPPKRFGRFMDGSQPLDVFGLVLEKPSHSVSISCDEQGPVVESWKVSRFRNPSPSDRTINATLASIDVDLARSPHGLNQYARPLLTRLRVASKLLLGRYPPPTTAQD